jgi:membrane-bound lytic murein transglycosylase F
MKQESRFSPTAESGRGAYGLMQLMPETSEEIARDLSIDDLSHPNNNIRGGVYYMRQLYDLFEGAAEADRIKLTLAAYNAGIGRIYDAQDLAAYLREDPLTWKSIRDMLPLLSRRYDSLHRSVWDGEKPKAGYFGNSGETVKYVESVMGHYDDYRLMLN